jgi:hypothetical protein
MYKAALAPTDIAEGRVNSELKDAPAGHGDVPEAPIRLYLYARIPGLR